MKRRQFLKYIGCACAVPFMGGPVKDGSSLEFTQDEFVSSEISKEGLCLNPRIISNECFRLYEDNLFCRGDQWPPKRWREWVVSK